MSSVSDVDGGPTLHRYVYKGEGSWGCGWAIFVLGSDGFFAAVSDYGNYAFKWSAMGCEWRQFFSRCDRSPDYYMSKLGQGANEYDGDRTLASVKRRILRDRRGGSIDADRAREEWDLLDRHSGLFSREDYALWYQETRIDTAYELAVYDYPPMLRAFCEKALPKLAAMLRAEDARSRLAAAVDVCERADDEAAIL
jgi:hypothetical protein